MGWIIAGLALMVALAYGADSTIGLDWDESTFTAVAVVGVLSFLAVGRLIRGAW